MFRAKHLYQLDKMFYCLKFLHYPVEGALAPVTFTGLSVPGKKKKEAC